jgi:hypothetical protein
VRATGNAAPVLALTFSTNRIEEKKNVDINRRKRI